MHGNTLQLLQEFKRYQESIKRPSIQRELVAERESLLGKENFYLLFICYWTLWCIKILEMNFEIDQSGCLF